MVNSQSVIAQRFVKLFAGRKDARGTLQGGCIKERLKMQHVTAHLEGKYSLGRYPLLDDGRCKWACVDFDFRTHKSPERLAEEKAREFAEKLFELGLKSSYFERSKSGLIHLWLFFSDFIEAKKVRRILLYVARELSLNIANGEVEIFPKQNSLVNGQVGNYIHLPYFGGLNGKPLKTRVMIDPVGFCPIPLLTFLGEAEENLISPIEVDAVYESLPKEKTLKTKVESKGGDIPHKEEITEILSQYWVEGRRQDLSMYVAGYFAKQGFAWDATRDLIVELAERNEDGEMRLRLASVKATYERAKRGEGVKGFRGLEEVLEPGDLKRLASFFESPRVKVVEQFQDEIIPTTSPKEVQFPEEAWRRVFEEYRELTEPTTEAPPSFHYGAFATVFGAMLKRDVHVNYAGPLYPNFFTALIGRTGTEKKDTAINRARRFLSTEELLVEIIGTGSAEGLLEQFMDEETEIEGRKTKTVLKPVDGRCILSTEYEFSRFLAKSTQKGSNLLTTYTQLYDCPDEYSPPTRSNRITTKSPTLSFLTGSTMAGCEKYLNDEHVGSGFLNRIMFFVDKTDRLIPFPPKPDSALVERFKLRLQKVFNWVRDLGDGEISVSPRARGLWEDFYVEWQTKRRAANPLLADAWSRIPNHIWKLAMLYAVADKRTEISQDDLELAILVGDYLEKTSAIIVGHLAKSKTTKVEENILSKLRSTYPKGLTKNQIHMMVSGRVTSGALDKILDGMAKMNLIREVDIKCKDAKTRRGYVVLSS